MNPITTLYSTLNYSQRWVNYFYDDINKFTTDDDNIDTFKKLTDGTVVGLAKNIAIVWVDDDKNIAEKTKWVIEKQVDEISGVLKEGLSEWLKYAIKLLIEMIKILFQNPYVLGGGLILLVYMYRR